VKKLSLALLFITICFISFSQDTTSNRRKPDKRENRKQKINELIKQSEEGVLVYRKQSILGLQFRTNGYGAYFELGRMKTTRRTMTYRVDFTEIKHQKEDKQPNDGFPFGNSFIYGKINHFYQLTFGIGQQYILGQKGNKNGVAVSAVYSGGLSIGLLRPYYLIVEDPNTQQSRTIKYSKADSALFLGGSIISGAGFGKGWSEIKVKPGFFVKAGLRFDYGRFNEAVSGIEAGVSIEMYGEKIPIMADQKNKQLFFQGYIAILFGRRK
jgi:hypothetical protein